MTYVVTENCIKCKYMDCVEVCPVDCFYEGENMLVIHPDECIDCGVCEPECPAEAIKPDTEPGLERGSSSTPNAPKTWPNITRRRTRLPTPKSSTASRTSSTSTFRTRPARATEAERRRPAAETAHGTCALPPAIAGQTSFRLGKAPGPVAQWSEPAAHNGLVAGSSPAGPTNGSTKAMMTRRAFAGFVLLAGTTLVAASAHAEDPAAFCRGAGVDDTVRPIPPALLPAAERMFGVSGRYALQTTSYRCAGGAVLLCTVGANLNCGKADTRRKLQPVDDFYRANPNAQIVPMAVTGHDTVYEWRCVGGSGQPGRQFVAVDARGFIAENWKAVR